MIYFTFFRKETVPEEPISEEISEEDKEINSQLEELDILHQQANPEPLSQEEIDRQLEELDRLRA